MAVIVRSIEAPTNLQASLLEGGSLLPNTTYYWRVTVRNCNYNIQAAYKGVASPPSIEGSFTTTDTKKSVTLSWDAVTPFYGGAQYNVYLTTVSGNYGNGNTYCRQAVSLTSTSTSTNNLTIISASLQNTHDTFVIKNNPYFSSSYPTAKLLGGIDVETGVITVEIDGNVGAINLWTIKNAVDDAGLSDYCYYDGHTFVLKGSIYVGSTASGYLKEYMKSINIIQGNWLINSSNFYFQFGEYNSILNRAYYGCTIAWYGWSVGLYTSYTKMYDCYISANKMPAVSLLYGADTYLNLNPTQDLKGCTFGGVAPRSYGGTTSGYVASGLIFNFPLDCRHYFNDEVEGTEYNHTTGTIYIYNPSFRNCKFIRGSYSSHFVVSQTYNVNDIVKFFDCNFADTEDNLPLVHYNGLNVDKTFATYHSLKIMIVNNEGNPIENAVVKLVNKLNETQFELQSDSSGNVNGGDILINKRSRDTSGGGTSTYNLIETDYNPFTLTVSKEGYEDYILVFTHNKKLDTTIALIETKPVVYFQDSLDGDVQEQQVDADVASDNLTGDVNNDIVQGKII